MTPLLPNANINDIKTTTKISVLPLVAESYADITAGYNNIQNLHVVIPHINGEAVNHSATKRQPKSPLLIVGKCWHEIDLVSHFIFYDLKKKVLYGGID